MPNVKKEYTRINAYVNPDVKKRLDDYAKENYVSSSAALNMILKQWFDSQEAVKSLGNLTALMQVFAKQTGIDLGELGERDGAQSDGAFASSQTSG